MAKKSKKRKKKTAGKARPKPAATPKRGLLIRLLLLASGVAIGILLPWVLYLNMKVTQEFEGRRWDLPSRVYARPLSLYPGQAISGNYLREELEAAGYEAVAQVRRPGQYRQQGARFDIYSRPFPFEDGAQSAQQFSLSVENGAVSRLADAAGSPVGVVRLDPAEIASIYPLDQEDRTLIQLQQVPDLLVQGLQAVEDRNFKHHEGVDFRGIARALWANIRHGGVVQGGSTITQQLVKNFYLSNEQTLIRKANEALMALLLEWHYDKAEILQAYINEVWLGQQGAHAIHGFARASEFYFGQSLNTLEPDQIALLVALVKGASLYNPRRNPERALQRRNQVLQVFTDTGLISPQQRDRWRQEPLKVTPRPVAASGAYPAFLDWVKRQLRRGYREQDLRREGLRIYTTLEPATQRAAERAVAQGLQDLASRGLPADLQAALVVVDVHSGETLAMVGDRHLRRRGFNRALDARRQIGSVIKPLIYLLALEYPGEFNLLTPLQDQPLELKLANGQTWTPKNYDGLSHGEVSLIDALVHSYNQATVSVGLRLGVSHVLQALDRFGIDSSRIEAVPALLLGALELTPVQVAQMYQSLASGGYTVPLRGVTAVMNQAGDTLSRYSLRLQPLKNRRSVALINYALTEAVQRGTARSLPGLLPGAGLMAGKTGTTNERRDSWFVGYTQNRLAVVWVGRDDNRAAGVTGSNAALKLWARLFQQLPSDGLVLDTPAGVDWFWINRELMALSAEHCPGAEKMPFLEDGLPQRKDECIQDDTWWSKWFDKDKQ